MVFPTGEKLNEWLYKNNTHDEITRQSQFIHEYIIFNNRYMMILPLNRKLSIKIKDLVMTRWCSYQSYHVRRCNCHSNHLVNRTRIELGKYK